MKRAEKLWTVKLTGRELNYIERALHTDCRELRDMGAVGNVPELFRFQKKVLRKIELLRRPKRMCKVWR